MTSGTSEKPTTFEELEEQIHLIIPGAELQIDEDTGEVFIYTNLIADEDGDLSSLLDDEDDSIFDDGNDEEVEDEDDELDLN